MGKLQKSVILLLVLINSVAFCYEQNNAKQLEQEFSSTSKNCQKSAERIHGNGRGSANAELNHYLTCVVKMIETDYMENDEEKSLALNEKSSDLSKLHRDLSLILSDPLFSKDIGNGVVKRSAEDDSAPQLDDRLIAALANSPEALKLVVEFLKKQGKLNESNKAFVGNSLRRSGNIEQERPSNNPPRRSGGFWPLRGSNLNYGRRPQQHQRRPQRIFDDRRIQGRTKKEKKPEKKVEDLKNVEYPWQLGFVPFPRSLFK